MAGTLAPQLAALAGGLLALYAGWRAPFWLSVAGAVAALVLLALSARALPHARPAPPQYAHLLGNAEYWRYAAAHALFFGAAMFFAASTPVLVKRYLGLGPEHIAALQMAGALGLSIGSAWALHGKFKDGPVGMVVTGVALQGFAAVALFGFMADETYPLPLVCGFSFLLSLGMGVQAIPLVAGALKAAGSDAPAGLALLLFLGHACAAAAIQLTGPWLAEGELPVLGTTLLLLVLAGGAFLPRFIWRAMRSNL
jgi:DHA1 family bicyclomycin/chloramphenicol resistance-like MFS transporter